MKFFVVASVTTFLATMGLSASFAPPRAHTTPPPAVHWPTTRSSPRSGTTRRALMESDFASAMPEAPKLTQREFLQQAADRSIASLQGGLGDGVDPVPALAHLPAVRNDPSATEQDLAAAIYVLMIERGMTYDEDPDTGILTPTNFDIANNLDVPQVQKEFAFLYDYGMKLIANGYVEMEKVKEIVQERLIQRTGLSPQQFDAWLGY